MNCQNKGPKPQPNKNTAESTENISVVKRLLKMKTYKLNFLHISRHFIKKYSFYGSIYHAVLRSL